MKDKTMTLNVYTKSGILYSMATECEFGEDERMSRLMVEMIEHNLHKTIKNNATVTLNGKDSTVKVPGRNVLKFEVIVGDKVLATVENKFTEEIK